MPSTAAITKPVLPPLQTPKSASFPSEIVSTPMSAVMSAVIKQEQDLRTPITPPTAYTDFIKALTPIMASPPHSALNRTSSDDSTTSYSSKSSFGSLNGESRSPPATAGLPPPTPMSAGCPTGRNTPATLKRLRIPQYSPVSAYSPATARSPYTALSSSMVYSPFSPAEWAGRSNFDFISTPRSACSKPVSVKSVITRTVTYKRTPNLEPAPKGKKRKISNSTSSIPSIEDMRQSLKETKRDGQQDVTSKPETKTESESTVEIKSEAATHEMPPPPAIAVSPATTESTSSAEP